MTTRPSVVAGILALAVLGAGCLYTHHRYVDLKAARQEALKEARASAAAAGICPAHHGPRLIALVRKNKRDGASMVPLDCDRLTPALHRLGNIKQAARVPRSDLASYDTTEIDVVAHEHQGETRIELSGKPEAPLERILPGAPAHEYRVLWTPSRHGGLAFEPAFTLGVTSAGGRTFWEGELVLMAGPRIWRRCGGVLAPAPEHSLSVLPRLGLGLEVERDLEATFGDDRPLTYRLGMALQYDRVQTVSPIPGAHLKQGMRAVARLTVDVVRGGREGVEVGLTALPAAWVGGLYARAGRQTAPTRGTTFSAGLELGEATVLGAASVAFAVAVGYLIKELAEATRSPEEDALAP